MPPAEKIFCISMQRCTACEMGSVDVACAMRNRLTRVVGIRKTQTPRRPQPSSPPGCLRRSHRPIHVATFDGHATDGY
jgi:hypothetical protein